jgi:tRNA nucleotidyltransferase (CCA-adding enzyme)
VLDQVYAAIERDVAAKTASEVLSQHGGEVYVVGGAIRDALLNKAPKDVDMLCRNLTVDQISHLLREYGSVNLTGQKFGVIRFKIGEHEVEIALPRTEVSTGKGRYHFEVNADPTLPIEKDLARRDFTANAMALNLRTGELVDPFGGQNDILDHKLRIVNNDAFAEDATRVLRAITALAKNRLVPDEHTKRLMEQYAPEIKEESPEAIQKEMDKILSAPDPTDAIRLMQETGVMHYVLPEVAKTFGFNQNNPYHDLDVGEHTLQVLRKMSQLSDDPDMRLAALMHDIGKPDSYSENPDKAWVDPEGNVRPRGNFYRRMLPNGEWVGRDHEAVGAQQTENAMSRLRYPNRRIKRVKELVDNHMFDYLENPRQARRLLNTLNGLSPSDPEYGQKMALDLMKVREADASGKRVGTVNPEEQQVIDKNRALLQDAIDSQNAFSMRDLAINGNDLINMGYKPGPEIGSMLNWLLDQVISDPSLNEKETLLSMIPPPNGN